VTRQQTPPIADRGKVAPPASERSAGGNRGPRQTVEVRPSQRTEDDLDAAEYSLRELDERHIQAKRAWANAMRASGNGTGTSQQVLAAQAALEGAENARRLEHERIEALRLRLYDQRRRELLMETVSGQDVARTEARRSLAEKDQARSFLSRLFGRK
jgi:hypothetical protein